MSDSKIDEQDKSGKTDPGGSVTRDFGTQDITFRAYRVVMVALKGQDPPLWADFEIFELFNVDGEHALAFSHPDGAESGPVLVGHIKWDGCSEVYNAPDNNVHVCDPGDYVALGKALSGLHEMASEILPMT